MYSVHCSSNRGIAHECSFRTQRSATGPVSRKNAKLADQCEWQPCLALRRLRGQELVRERLAVNPIVPWSETTRRVMEV
jgi:hypothetical protein